jgi:hypothetical protein
MVRAGLIWAGLMVALAVPVGLATASPLLQWRDPVYVVAGLAGVLGLALLAVQPLLAAGALPGLAGTRGRWLHRLTGAVLVLGVVVHVAGLWITSPPDVIDALLFRSPTPFAPWGVIAMWATLGTAALAALRRPLRLRWRTWRAGHLSLAGAIVVGTVVHALLIDGTMEPVSKGALCVLVALAALNAARRRQAGTP